MSIWPRPSSLLITFRVMFLTFRSEGMGDGVNVIRGDGERWEDVLGGERTDWRFD